MMLRYVERFVPAHPQADFGTMQKILQIGEWEGVAHMATGLKGEPISGMTLVWRDVPTEPESGVLDGTAGGKGE